MIERRLKGQFRLKTMGKNVAKECLLCGNCEKVSYWNCERMSVQLHWNRMPLGRMSVQRRVPIDLAYQAIIDETIRQCIPHQSAAVLEKLRQKWVERLEWKLANPSVGLKPPSAPPTAAAPPAGRGPSPVVKVPTASPTSSLAGLPTASPGPPLLMTPSAPRPAPAAEDEDDWGEAEWHAGTDDGAQPALGAAESPEAAAPPAPALPKPAAAEPTSAAAAEGAAAPLPPGLAMPLLPALPPGATGASGPDGAGGAAPASLAPSASGLVLQSNLEDELFDAEEDIDEETLSELDDFEPPCSGLIVGQFECVQRPHVKKALQKSVWKIKLRNGVLQTDGQEILFNVLSGDLTF